jgi:hypothetical protein
MARSRRWRAQGVRTMTQTLVEGGIAAAAPRQIEVLDIDRLARRIPVSRQLIYFYGSVFGL